MPKLLGHRDLAENTRGKDLMKRSFFAVAIAALASVLLAATASAGVSRYQEETTATATATTTTTATTPSAATFTVTQPAGAENQWDHVWTHEITVTINPDGTFTGNGIESGADQMGPQTLTETISGSFADDFKSVSFTATRNDGI